MKQNLQLLFLLLLVHTSCNSQHLASKRINWTVCAEPNNNYEYNIALSVNDRIYTLGGNKSGTFEVYDLKAEKWASLVQLSSPRFFGGGTTILNSIYFVGGIDVTGKNYATVEKYNIDKDKWSICRSLSAPTSRLAVVSCAGKIYAIGGLKGPDDRNSINSNTLEEYDAETDLWIFRKNMPTPRHGHSAIAVNNKILVIGGYTYSGNYMVPTGIVEEYNPATDEWTKKADMPTARGFLGVVAIDKFIYAIAGRVRLEKGPVEQYDYIKNVWIKLESLPLQRNRFGITAIKNNVYIVGGEDHPKSFIIGKLCD